MNDDAERQEPDETMTGDPKEGMQIGIRLGTSNEPEFLRDPGWWNEFEGANELSGVGYQLSKDVEAFLEGQ